MEEENTLQGRNPTDNVALLGPLVGRMEHKGASPPHSHTWVPCSADTSSHSCSGWSHSRDLHPTQGLKVQPHSGLSSCSPAQKGFLRHHELPQSPSPGRAPRVAHLVGTLEQTPVAAGCEGRDPWRSPTGTESPSRLRAATLSSLHLNHKLCSQGRGCFLEQPAGMTLSLSCTEDQQLSALQEGIWALLGKSN